MKLLKKRTLVRTIFSLSILLLIVAAGASAQDDQSCSNAGVAGQWGYTETGWVMQQGSWVPAASQGRYTLDRDGNVSGTRYGNVGGKTTLEGTATVNSDCTGTLTVRMYDQSGNLLFTGVKALLYVDRMREVRAIVTSVILPNGTGVPAVLTVDGKKLFPNNGNEQ